MQHPALLGNVKQRCCLASARNTHSIRNVRFCQSDKTILHPEFLLFARQTTYTAIQQTVVWNFLQPRLVGLARLCSIP